MTLSDEDVREILRIIDESDLTELQIQTDGFALHVVKGERKLAAATPAAPPPQSTAPAPAPAAEPQDGLATITAPMLGTFYRAEAPGKPPFVEVGARVEPDTIVCIIEVMKMMNSVTAGASGTIVRIFAENAQLVEYGEPLFEIGAA
ncbi:MAG TPA: acetyl-CoA carboxylase biotin carboxyl carrier protein [Solirubrobacteraceae bacterium]|nr:acetyl-CoA carboxylase biotin carboxyl carrier protein [Solirubrobacteraceae bacterium]